MSMQFILQWTYRCKHGARFRQWPCDSRSHRHGSPMSSSLARFQILLLAAVLALVSACATLPPPTGELSSAQQALLRAEGADADQYASAEIAAARAGVSQAQAAMTAGRDSDARRLALNAAADADLAYARSREAVVTAELTQRRNEIQQLRQTLQTEGQP